MPWPKDYYAERGLPMKNEALNYEVIFGSNRILNCGRVVEIVGKGINKQFVRFREGEDRKILFECTVTDEKGETVAKIANSRIQHIVPGYKTEISDEGIKVVNEKSGEVWLEFVSIGPRRFKLNGIFFLPGFRIIATDEGMNVNSNIFAGNTFVNCAAAIGLGPRGMGLG